MQFIDEQAYSPEDLNQKSHDTHWMTLEEANQRTHCGDNEAGCDGHGTNARDMQVCDRRLFKARNTSDTLTRHRSLDVDHHSQTVGSCSSTLQHDYRPYEESTLGRRAKLSSPKLRRKGTGSRTSVDAQLRWLKAKKIVTKASLTEVDAMNQKVTIELIYNEHGGVDKSLSMIQIILSGLPSGQVQIDTLLKQADAGMPLVIGEIEFDALRLSQMLIERGMRL